MTLSESPTPAPALPAGAEARPAISTHPPLMIRERDERRLYEIAVGAMLSAPRLAGGLLDEISRATVRPDALVPAQVIGLGSIVACCEGDDPGSSVRWVQVVAPEDADPERGRISVLSGLGAALIGLAPGQSILWRDRVGGLRQVLVLEVTPGDHEVMG